MFPNHSAAPLLGHLQHYSQTADTDERHHLHDIRVSGHGYDEVLCQKTVHFGVLQLELRHSQDIDVQGLPQAPPEFSASDMRLQIFYKKKKKSPSYRGEKKLKLTPSPTSRTRRAPGPGSCRQCRAPTSTSLLSSEHFRSPPHLICSPVGPLFRGKRCQVIHPSIRQFNYSPGH